MTFNPPGPAHEFKLHTSLPVWTPPLARTLPFLPVFSLCDAWFASYAPSEFWYRVKARSGSTNFTEFFLVAQPQNVAKYSRFSNTKTSIHGFRETSYLRAVHICHFCSALHCRFHREDIVRVRGDSLIHCLGYFSCGCPLLPSFDE